MILLIGNAWTRTDSCRAAGAVGFEPARIGVTFTAVAGKLVGIHNDFLLDDERAQYRSSEHGMPSATER